MPPKGNRWPRSLERVFKGQHDMRGKKGLRASERKNLPLRGSLRGPLKTLSKISENLSKLSEKPLKTSEKALKNL